MKKTWRYFITDWRDYKDEDSVYHRDFLILIHTYPWSKTNDPCVLPLWMELVVHP